MLDPASVSVPGGKGVGHPREQGGGPSEEDGWRLWGEGEPHHHSVHCGRRGSQQVRPPVMELSYSD